MSALGKIVAAPFKALGLISTPAPPPVPLAPPTRDDAVAATDSDDAIRRRKGSAADILLGPAAGNAAPGATVAKTIFGQ